MKDCQRHDGAESNARASAPAQAADWAGGILLFAAVSTSLMVWIVGLALPVPASSIICAVIAVPALIELGVPDVWLVIAAPSMQYLGRKLQLAWPDGFVAFPSEGQPTDI